MTCAYLPRRSISKTFFKILSVSYPPIISEYPRRKPSYASLQNDTCALLNISLINLILTSHCTLFLYEFYYHVFSCQVFNEAMSTQAYVSLLIFPIRVFRQRHQRHIIYCLSFSKFFLLGFSGVYTVYYCKHSLCLQVFKGRIYMMDNCLRGSVT